MAFKLLGRHRAEHEKQPGERRRSVRHQVGWSGLYVVTDEPHLVAYRPESEHSPCVVHDLSMAGAGLELSSPELAIGDRVVLDLQLGEHQRASIQLTGEVRHTQTTPEGLVRVGIEFFAVGDLERALLVRLLRQLRPAHQSG